MITPKTVPADAKEAKSADDKMPRWGTATKKMRKPGTGSKRLPQRIGLRPGPEEESTPISNKVINSGTVMSQDCVGE